MPLLLQKDETEASQESEAGGGDQTRAISEGRARVGSAAGGDAGEAAGGKRVENRATSETGDV